jgi:predicted transcriptional regulator
MKTSETKLRVLNSVQAIDNDAMLEQIEAAISDILKVEVAEEIFSAKILEGIQKGHADILAGRTVTKDEARANLSLLREKRKVESERK